VVFRDAVSVTAEPTPGVERARRIVRIVLAIAMVAVGITHFTSPAGFVRIVPAWLPAPLLLVHISGLIEILLGATLIPRVTRRLASYGLVALYVAVFPANINMAVNQIQLDPASPIPVWAMWARLPLQLVLIAIALWVGRDAKRA
jgi:uncharacterized membrane protein